MSFEDPFAAFRVQQPSASEAQPAFQDPYASFRAPEPSIAQDVLNSAGTGVIKGGTDIVAMPSTAVRFLEGLADGMVTAPARIYNRIAGDHSWSVPASLEARARAADANRLKVGLTDILPTSEGVQKLVEDVTGSPLYQPQTRAGKFAQAATQFGTSAAVGPGGIANVLKFGVVPGVVSEAAGQATEGTKAEPWVRAGTALATGIGGSLLTRPGVQDRMISQATRAASDADINAAMKLMSDGAQRGVKLTWPEALEQVTGGATQAGRLQRLVEGTKEGGAVMAPAMAERPGQVARAVSDTAGRIAPASLPTPAGIAGQKAAESSIQNVRQNINAAEKPYYDAANMKSAKPDALRFISEDPVFQQALKEVRNDAIRNKDIASLATNDVGTLIAVRKQMARMESEAMNPGAGKLADTELARNITPVRNRLDQIITQAAPEYGQALGVGAGLRETKLDPLVAGPVGKVAATNDLGSQVRALFPSAPMEGAARETSAAIRSLDSAAPAIARQHLMTNFAEAAQNNIPGANQWGGAKFAAQIAGNPLQRQVLDANLSALPNGAQKAADVRGLLDVLEATGKRQQQGSLTAFNASDLKDLSSGGLVSGMVDAARTANPLGLARQLKDGFDRARLGSRAESMAMGLLSDPSVAAQIIQEARKRAPQGRFGRELLGILSGSNPALRHLLPAER